MSEFKYDFEKHYNDVQKAIPCFDEDRCPWCRADVKTEEITLTVPKSYRALIRAINYGHGEMSDVAEIIEDKLKELASELKDEPTHWIFQQWLLDENYKIEKNPAYERVCKSVAAKKKEIKP